MLAQKDDEVDPAEKDAHGPELPLPTREAVELEVADKDDGGHVQKSLEVVDVGSEVLAPMVYDLAELNGDAGDTVDDNDD